MTILGHQHVHGNSGRVMVIDGSGSRGRMRHAFAGLRVACGLLAGAAAGVTASQFMVSSASILVGWDVAVAVYLAWTWSAVWGMDSGLTAERAKREDPSIPVADLLLIGAGVAALAAVALALVKASQTAGGTKAFLITLGLLSVVLSWTLVHTVYALRYARAYYSEPTGGIDFNEDEPPSYIDFAYFAFTVGMTFQVSDTNITMKAVRRLTLRHALLSYLFGAVLLGLVINVVSALLK